MGFLDRQIWRRPTGAQPNRLWKEGEMLSTTVEPECLQRPFVTSYAMIGPRIGEAAAHSAPTREATKVLADNIIHPTADRIEAYGATARAISTAVH
ncbi:hypothetical protein [Mycobacterium sp.]|uniref:hypothetical protein n=1 Tax=Mycobacterium sp. TaxID=1785 RepID=UPI003BAF0448